MIDTLFITTLSGYLLELVHGVGRLAGPPAHQLRVRGLVRQGGALLLQQPPRIRDSLGCLGVGLGLLGPGLRTLEHRADGVPGGERPEAAAVTLLPLEHHRGFLLQLGLQRLLATTS